MSKQSIGEHLHTGIKSTRNDPGFSAFEKVLFAASATLTYSSSSVAGSCPYANVRDVRDGIKEGGSQV